MTDSKLREAAKELLEALHRRRDAGHDEGVQDEEMLSAHEAEERVEAALAALEPEQTQTALEIAAGSDGEDCSEGAKGPGNCDVCDRLAKRIQAAIDTAVEAEREKFRRMIPHLLTWKENQPTEAELVQAREDLRAAGITPEYLAKLTQADPPVDPEDKT